MGSKHRSMAQWAREAEQLCFRLSASITNREKAKKWEAMEEEATSTPPTTETSSYKTAVRGSFLPKNTTGGGKKSFNFFLTSTFSGQCNSESATNRISFQTEKGS